MAASGVAHRVTIVDDAVDVARGKALDIHQAGALEPSDADVAGSADLAAVVGRRSDRRSPTATDPAPSEWTGEDGLQLLARVRALNPRAPDRLRRRQPARRWSSAAVLEQGADRRRLVGSAPEALRAAVVALTSLEAGLRPARRVADPDWPASRRRRSCRGPTPPSAASAAPPCSIRRRLRASTPGCRGCGRRARWRWAAAAGRVVRLALVGGPGSACVFAVPDQAGEIPRRGAALPVSFWPDGLRVVVPQLSTRDRVRLEGVLRR